MMRRIPDVLDCCLARALRPGALPSNVEWFESHYPGDFIVVSARPRLVLHPPRPGHPPCSTGPPSSCVSHGILLGNDRAQDGEVDCATAVVSMVFDRDGADAMRWFLLSAPVMRGQPRGHRQGHPRHRAPGGAALWNAWYFFALYAGQVGQSGYV